MVCEICGEVIADDVIPAAGRLIALRHASRGEQAVAGFVLSLLLLAGWKAVTD